jgi:D-alanyl-D-alanine carboxypeptidase/D-alanyl-D-alanine-endopeptidase (penicillin-binding protein 4)
MTFSTKYIPIAAITFLLLIYSPAFGQNSVTTRPRVTPTPSSSPAVSPTVTPTPAPAQTLDSLQTQIRQRLYSLDVRRGRVGVKIVSLNTGKVILENDSEKYFMPASNMKNFTIATAMERLGPDFRFVTTVSAATPLGTDGVITGGLRIIGRGDVSMSTSFDPAFPGQTNYYRAIDMLAEKIVGAGVKRIEGGLIGDESYFQGFSVPDTWEWDDLQTYYGTEISALPVNDNVIDVSVKPQAAGNPCLVTILPQTQLVRVVNRCTTASGPGTLQIFKLMNQNIVEITGTVPPDAKERRESVAFSHAAELFIDLLRQRLTAKGVIIAGQDTITNVRAEPMCNTCSNLSSINIASLESPPFREIAAKTMKPSQNMYTETILWTLGEQIGRKNSSNANSSRLGLDVVKAFLKEIGIPNDGIVQYDGSGLSRHDLITPSAVVTLYSYMAKQSKYTQAWRDSLTIAGVDGTLRNRFKGTAAAGNFRGKTGTIDQVSALSGYLTTAGGEQLVVSIIVNGVPTGSMRTSLIDDIVVSLANFDGRID